MTICVCGLVVSARGYNRGSPNHRRGWHATCPQCSWHRLHDDYEELTWMAEQHLKTHLEDLEAALESAA